MILFPTESGNLVPNPPPLMSSTELRKKIRSSKEQKIISLVWVLVDTVLKDTMTNRQTEHQSNYTHFLVLVLPQEIDKIS